MDNQLTKAETDIEFTVREPTKRELDYNPNLTEVKVFKTSEPAKATKRKMEYEADTGNKILKICEDTTF